MSRAKRRARPVEPNSPDGPVKALAKEAQLARAEGPEIELVEAPALTRRQGRGRPGQEPRRRVRPLS